MATYKKYKLKPKKSIDGKTLKPEERWMVKGYLGIDPKTGLDKYTTLRGFTSKKSAADGYDDAVYEFKHGLRQATPKRPTIREAYESWYPMWKDTVRPATQRDAKQNFEHHIIPDFGDYFVDQLTPMDIQPWVNKLCRKFVTGPTIFGRLKMLLKFAGGMGWITINPAAMITIPHDRKRTSNHAQNNVYSIDELQQFSDALDREATALGTPAIMRRAFFRVIISTGVRRGEAIALTWDDVNFRDKTISITKTVLPKYNGVPESIGEPKTDHGNRLLKVGDDVLGSLMQWRNRQEPNAADNWVFTSRWEQHPRISYLLPQRWMELICERNNLRYITVHGLRHTKATLMAEDDISATDIAGTLGHSNSKFTVEHYIHNTQAGLNNASDKYNELLTKTVWSKSGHKNENIHESTGA